jgi:hypothetical protein
MVDETQDEADNEITRIVRRPGPKVLPVSIMTPPPVGEAAPAAAPAVVPPVVPPRAQANDVAPAVAAPPVMLERPKPVMTPPQRPAAPPLPNGMVPVAARPGPVPPMVVPTPVARPVAADVPKPAAIPAAAPVAPAVHAVEAPKAAAPIVADPIEPVVGWLVVVKGPGRGVSRTIVTGRNSLGSGADEDIRIDFGDTAIASHGHLYIVYDEEAREFVVEDGKQKVVVRLNGKLLTETMPIGHGDELRIGATTFRFVALCGPDFDWHEPQTEEKSATDAVSEATATITIEADKT